MPHNPEYEPREKEKTDGGFSEKESALDIEVRAGEWQNLKKFKTYQQRSRQGKIIATYQAVSNRLNQLVALYYKFVSAQPGKAVKMLEELRRLRFLQEVLLNCLVWSRQSRGSAASPGELNDKEFKAMVPEDVWELIS